MVFLFQLLFSCLTLTVQSKGFDFENHAHVIHGDVPKEYTPGRWTPNYTPNHTPDSTVIHGDTPKEYTPGRWTPNYTPRWSHCSKSSICESGTSCRVGDSRCLSDDDCENANNADGTSRDCTPIWEYSEVRVGSSHDERVKQIISDLFGIDVKYIQNDSLLSDDLGLDVSISNGRQVVTDGMDIFWILEALEDEYGFRWDDNGDFDFHYGEDSTVQDIIDALDNKIGCELDTRCDITLEDRMVRRISAHKHLGNVQLIDKDDYKHCAAKCEEAYPRYTFWIKFNTYSNCKCYEQTCNVPVDDYKHGAYKMGFQDQCPIDINACDDTFEDSHGTPCGIYASKGWCWQSWLHKYADAHGRTADVCPECGCKTTDNAVASGTMERQNQHLKQANKALLKALRSLTTP